MRATIRRLGLGALRLSGAQRILFPARQGPIVLFYHGVEEKIVDPDVQQLHTPLKKFERQVAFLRRHREIISIDHLYEALACNRALDPKQVVLTFDDGYRNNAQIVAPLLHSWNIPFTVFISTRHIEEHRRFGTYYVRAAIHHTRMHRVQFLSIGRSFDLTTHANRLAAERIVGQFMKRAPQKTADQVIAECIALVPANEWPELDARFRSDEPMSWDDVNYIRSLGGTIGSHCYDHCILHANQPEEVIYRQLRLSKEAIERNAAECNYFSYPNGTLNDISKLAYCAVKATKFRLCFTTIAGEFTHGVDRHLAPRFGPKRDYEEFCFTLSQTGRQNQRYFDSCRLMQADQLALSKS